MRTHLINNVKVPFTQAEETARDTEVAAILALRPAIDIQTTYQASLEVARGSVSVDDLNRYQSLWEEIKRRQHDATAPIDELTKFATARGKTVLQSIKLVRDIIKPIREAEATALGVRDKELDEL